MAGLTKSGKFVKNMALAVAVAVPTGMGVAELTSLLTNSEAMSSLGALAGQIVGASAVFFPLHAHDNKDVYTGEGTKSFDWREFGKDVLKVTGCAAAFDTFYGVAKPSLTYFFQRKGFDPATASLASDAICIPVYCAGYFKAIKRLGVIR